MMARQVGVERKLAAILCADVYGYSRLMGEMRRPASYDRNRLGRAESAYIFQHRSGTFALYYELQSNELLTDISGGGSFPTCTIAIKNQVYIPVPEELRPKFIPTGNAKKRFAVRSDLLFPEGEVS